MINDYNSVPPKRSFTINVRYKAPVRGTPLPYPIDEAAIDRAARIAARAGVIVYEGQRYAVEWDGCPWCGE